MSLTMHLVVLAVLILDLLLGGQAMRAIGGRFAATAFEFAVILGYVIFVLQWGVPWGQRGQDDGGRDKGGQSDR